MLHSMTKSNLFSLKILQDIDPLAERGADVSNTPLTEPVTDLDTLVQALTQDMRTQESTGKGIAGAVGVDDLVVGELRHRVGLGVGLVSGEVAFALVRRGRGRGNEGRFGALSNDHESRAAGVGLGQVGDRGGDLSDG